MMGTLDELKARVRSARKSGRTHGLSYSQHLEVACRLIFKAPSLNHLTASPDDYTWFETDTFRGILERLQSASTVLDAEMFPDLDLPSGYVEYEKWWAAAEILQELLDVGSPGGLPELLLNATDLNSERMPRLLEPDGRMTSPLDPESSIPAEQRLHFAVSSWLPEEYRHEDKMLMGLWERMGRIAEANGMPENVAAYYRSICREAYNHSWSVQSQVALGLLDIPLEKASFFVREGNSEQAMATMEAIWREEEPMAF